MASYFNFEGLKTITFSKFPLLIQERFVEICDAQTLANFSKINRRTKWLSRNRKVVANFEINDGMNSRFKHIDTPSSTFSNFDKTIEITDELDIRVKNICEGDVKGILKTYSKLIISLENLILIGHEILKHLIGPNLKTCYINFRIPPNIEIMELQNKLRILGELLIPVNNIYLCISLQDNEDIVKNELLKLSKHPSFHMVFSLSIFNQRTREYYSKRFSLFENFPSKTEDDPGIISKISRKVPLFENFKKRFIKK